MNKGKVRKMEKKGQRKFCFLLGNSGWGIKVMDDKTYGKRRKAGKRHRELLMNGRGLGT